MKEYIYPARLHPLTRLGFKKGEKMELEDLRNSVAKILVSEYDFDVEEAQSAVETSVRDNEDMWNENAEPRDLAKYLADGDDD